MPAFVPFVERLRWAPPTAKAPPPPDRSLAPLSAKRLREEGGREEDARRKRRREEIVARYHAARDHLVALAPINAQSVPETLPQPRIDPAAPQPRVNSLVNIAVMRGNAFLRVNDARIRMCMPVVRLGRSSLRKYVLEASTPVHTHWSVQKQFKGPASAASCLASYFYTSMTVAMAIVAPGETVWVRMNELDENKAVRYRNEVNTPLLPHGYVLDVERLGAVLPTPPKALGPTISVQYPAERACEKRRRDAHAAGVPIAKKTNTVRATYFKYSASYLGRQTKLASHIRAMHEGIVAAYGVRAENAGT